MPRFSLVVSTKGRSGELAEMLSSLKAQTFKDFDVLVTDQNDVIDLRPLLMKDWTFPLRHVRRPHDRGLSRGRNIGWRLAHGQFILFPDDDCWYGPEFLAYADRQLGSTKADILTGRAADPTGRSINGRFETAAQSITRSNVWTTQIEWVSIFRRSVLEQIGGYDEDIGIGASSPWQACEGQDIILRALEAGATGYYDPNFFGHHAEIQVERPSADAVRKGRAYGRGMGYVLRRHGWGWGARGYWATRPLIKCGLYLARGDLATASYYRAVAMGRLEGACGRVFARS